MIWTELVTSSKSLFVCSICITMSWRSDAFLTHQIRLVLRSFRHSSESQRFSGTPFWTLENPRKVCPPPDSSVWGIYWKGDSTGLKGERRSWRSCWAWLPCEYRSHRKGTGCKKATSLRRSLDPHCCLHKLYGCRKGSFTPAQSGVLWRSVVACVLPEYWFGWRFSGIRRREWSCLRSGSGQSSTSEAESCFLWWWCSPKGTRWPYHDADSRCWSRCQASCTVRLECRHLQIPLKEGKIWQ